MKPTKITIRGITSAYPGTMTLDLDEAAGLVAFIGPNGAGKTTLLEALGPLTLYGSSPSRGCGVPRLAVSTDAVIDLEGEHNGQTWRIRREINPDRGQHDGYLWIDGVDANTAGKVSSLDDEIRRRFLPESLYLASIFASQHGRGSFVGLKEAERRDLFAALLGIEQLQTLSEGAREVAIEADAGIAEADRLLAELRLSEARRVALGLQHAALAEPLAEAEREAAALDQVARDLRSALTARERSANADRTRRAALLTKRSAAERGIEQLDAELATLLREIKDAATAAEQLPAAEEALVEYQREADRAASHAGALATAKRTVDQAEAAERIARKAATEAAAAIVAVEQAEAAWVAAEGKREDAARLRVERAELEKVVVDLDAEVARLERVGHEAAETARKIEQAHREQLAALSEAIGAGERGRERLAATPCQGRTLLSEGPETGFEGPVECHRCPLIADATAASDKLDQARADRAVLVEAGGERVTESARVLAEARADYARAKADAKVRRERLTEVGRTAGALELELARIPKVPDGELARRVKAAELADLDVTAAAAAADSALAELRELQARPVEGPTPLDVGVRRGQVEALRRAAGELLARRERCEGKVAERARLVEQLAEHVSELADLPPDNDAAITEARVRVEAAERSAASARQTAHERLAERSGLAGQLAELEPVPARLERATATRATLAALAGAYRLVETGLGRKGVQAHEIDGAGPTVSELVNDLLSSCYGDRFRVELITQQEASRNRKAKEVFELRIHDAERGDSRAFDSLSGGEQVVIDEAIKLALALLTTRRSGIRCRWLFRDEVDGKLDDANARRYPPMLRRAMEIGGFEVVAFVSHRPEVFEQADVVVRVAGGKATVEGLS